MRVLLVKLSSMGDLIHALPAISDAQRAIPGIEFDWVSDEAFIDIPHFHPAVKRVIKSSHRRWSKNKWQALRSGELVKFWRELRAFHYDMVLDAQSNIKSAIVTRLSRGLRCGMNKSSVSEVGAHLAYQKTFNIPPVKQLLAVTRQRMLFAQALGYPMPDTAPDFAIDIARLPALPIVLPKPYLVFLHSTTWDSKHWPESYWAELIQLATNAGYHVILPWGGKHEHTRALRLSETSSAVTVLPRLRISEQGSVIANSAGVVAVDTGLAHLTAALNVPAVHLYGPTDVNLLGIESPTQLFLSAEFECAPCYLRKCKFGDESKCFVEKLPPVKVWQALLDKIKI